MFVTYLLLLSHTTYVHDVCRVQTEEPRPIAHNIAQYIGNKINMQCLQTECGITLNTKQ